MRRILNALLIIKNYSKMVKLSHTVFALPFALVAVLIIQKSYSIEISLEKTMYIILAFTGARSFSMAANRIIDAKIDARNPRTENREIPKGILSKKQVRIFAITSLLVLWFFAWLLAPLAFYLSFPALMLLAGYSYSKRFTWLCHIWLGAVIGMAPVAVYIALIQQVDGTAWILFATLTFYISGFDILYSLQDLEFDRENKLYSIPSRFGQNIALVVSAVIHLFSIAGFFLLSYVQHFGIIYNIGAIILSSLIIGEHLIIGWGKNLKKDKIPMAFFHFNSAVSILFFLFTLVEIYVSVYKS